MTLFLHCSSSIVKTSRRFGFSPSLSRICPSTRRKLTIFSSTMSNLTDTITLPSQVGEQVEVVASPGVSEADFRAAIDSSLFKQWLKNMQSKTGILANGAIYLRGVLIQGVDMFGGRIGFLSFKADVIDLDTGKKVPGIIFARGPAIAVLILLDSDGQTYAVVTDQGSCWEANLVIAGWNFEEETGIHLNLEDVIDLTSFLDPSTGCKFFPSPRKCGKAIITQLQGKETGLREHDELIEVHVVPYEKLWRATADVMVLMAIALYEMAKK
ncbi:hypothetical protein RJ641_035436, partial [Dillenia turbinata]